MRRLVAAFVFTLPLAACGGFRHGYQAPAFTTITATHRQVAILPFHVSIDGGGLPRSATAEDHAKIEREEGLALQTQLYAQLLQRSGEFSVQFQDVAQTNAQLDRMGLSIQELYIREKDEIARLLGVDAVISAHVYGFQLDNGGSLTGLKNQVSVEIQVHNAENGAILWTFNDQTYGSILSTRRRLSSALVRSVARGFPYRRTAG